MIGRDLGVVGGLCGADVWKADVCGAGVTGAGRVMVPRRPLCFMAFLWTNPDEAGEKMERT